MEKRIKAETRGIKIAVTGKGGVGKTTVSAALAMLFAEEGREVIAVDCDPDANLASALGLPDPDKIIPIVKMKDLIAERTGTGTGSGGDLFRMNPDVSDILDRFSVMFNGIRFIRMGGARKGGSGCFCPESNFMKTLLGSLFHREEAVVILDMEAGIEHLSRGTSAGVDALIVVIEPGPRSVETALRIKEMARDLGIMNLFAVGNKFRDDDQFQATRRLSGPLDFLGYLYYNENLLYKIDNKFLIDLKHIKERLLVSVKKEKI